MSKRIAFKDPSESRDYTHRHGEVGKTYELYGQANPRPIDSRKRFTTKNTEWAVYWEIYRLNPDNPDEPTLVVGDIASLETATVLFWLFEEGIIDQRVDHLRKMVIIDDDES